MTLTVVTRSEFANAIRFARLSGTMKTYSRLAQFGRVLICRDGLRVIFSAWTMAPSMNIHR